MPTPLPEALSSILRTDSTAALAALMVIANAHREIFAWAARMFGAEPPGKAEPKPTGQAKQPSAHKPKGKATFPDARRATGTTRRSRQAVRGARCAVRDAPEGSIGSRMTAMGKSRWLSPPPPSTPSTPLCRWVRWAFAKGRLTDDDLRLL